LALALVSLIWLSPVSGYLSPQAQKPSGKSRAGACMFKKKRLHNFAFIKSLDKTIFHKSAAAPGRFVIDSTQLAQEGKASPEFIPGGMTLQQMVL
jgi:hypothetical protein